MLIRYALTALLVVGLGATGLSVLLEESGRRGVLLAALIAYPVQVVSFGLLVRAREQSGRFVVWWGAGIALRIAAVVGAGVASSRLVSVQPAAFLLSLVGFIFVLLLLEPVFFVTQGKGARTAT